MACSCSRGRASNTNCSNVNTGTLQGYKNRYTCVLSGGLFTEVSMTEQYVQNQITLLNTIILDKTNSPTSCTYQNQVNIIQADMVKITEFTNC